MARFDVAPAASAEEQLRYLDSFLTADLEFRWGKAQAWVEAAPPDRMLAFLDLLHTGDPALYTAADLGVIRDLAGLALGQALARSAAARRPAPV